MKKKQVTIQFTQNRGMKSLKMKQICKLLKFKEYLKSNFLS